MRKLMTLAALCVLPSALAFPQSPIPNPPSRLSARLVRVVDGDTIRVDIDLGADVVLKNQSLRLLGIDAPELRGPPFDSAQGPEQKSRGERSRGAESKAALAQFLKGRPLTVELHGKDKYGRWLADVFAGEENAALWMLRGKFARVYQIGRRGPTLPVEPSALDPTTYPSSCLKNAVS